MLRCVVVEIGGVGGSNTIVVGSAYCRIRIFGQIEFTVDCDSILYSL